MIRPFTPARAVFILLPILLSFNYSSGQSAPPDEILKWEADISLFDSLNLVEQSDKNTLLVAGSSSIRLWDSIHEDLAPYQVMQRGYGGAKMTDFTFYAHRIIKAQQFKAIVIFVANDIVGSVDDRTPREVFRLYKDLVKQVRKRNPHTPLCWIEVTPTPSRWDASLGIQEASNLIKTYCDKHEDLHFISTFDQFITPDELPDSTYFREDMLHLNSTGYQHWSGIIKGALEEAGIEP